MICLGIESTAHTFGVGIVDDTGKILANVKKTYTNPEGGLVPAKVAEHHVDVCDEILKNALQEAKLTINDIDVIAYSAAPGLGPMLKIGLVAAKTLALTHNKPLVPVNHCIAHLEIGKQATGAHDPVLLYVSGANTQVIAFEGGKYRVFGESLDGGVGNFIDSFARELGLGFPGGPKVEALAKQGKTYVELPYTVKGMDISVGGLFTNLKQKIASKKFKPEDLAHSLQETVFAMLVEVAERALAHCGKTELVLGGGVCCNMRLQDMAKKMCDARGAKCFVPEKSVLVDNGAMIAWTGLIMHRAGISIPVEQADIFPYQRTDEVAVTWK